MIENSFFMDLIFYIVSAAIILLAIVVIFISDIFRAAIALAGTFLGIAVVYFMPVSYTHLRAHETDS